jgi:hypothetical protein
MNAPTYFEHVTGQPELAVIDGDLLPSEIIVEPMPHDDAMQLPAYQSWFRDRCISGSDFA